MSVHLDENGDTKKGKENTYPKIEGRVNVAARSAATDRTTYRSLLSSPFPFTFARERANGSYDCCDSGGGGKRPKRSQRTRGERNADNNKNNNSRTRDQRGRRMSLGKREKDRGACRRRRRHRRRHRRRASWEVSDVGAFGTPSWYLELFRLLYHPCR